MDASSPLSRATRWAAASPVTWPALAIAVAIWPVAGVFTWSRAFIMRDLTLYFWPRYQWLRDTVRAGDWPWWDPYMGGGQSAVADALNQFFLLPTLALRLLLPEPVGFNLWVALPFPLAAAGTYLYLRRHVSAPGAALGAVVFAVAGPIVSTGNFPNLSWAVLFVPWLVWAVDRCAEQLTAKRLAVMAVLYAAQGCAGEPVTLAATTAVVVAYAALGCSLEATGLRSRVRLVAGTACALATGLALAAVQLVPLWIASRASARGTSDIDTAFWSTHPLTLLEGVAPNLFGNFMVTFMAYQPWLRQLNSGRDPFYLSLYVGVGVMLLAMVGVLLRGRQRWAPFWVGVGGVALLCALGDNTPFYPVVRTWVPFVHSFRYPAKYLTFVCLSLASLAALGWSALESLRTTEPGDVSRVTVTRRLVTVAGLLLAIVTYAGAAVLLFWPDTAALGLYRLASVLEIAGPTQAVELLQPELPAHAARLLLIALGATVLLWAALSARREARLARWLLYGFVMVDLAVTNGTINPSGDVALLRSPDWVDVVRQHPHERFYFGGRLWGGVQMADVEGPTGFTLAPYADWSEVRALTSNGLVVTPSSAQVREMMSFDLTSLWPLEHTRVEYFFSQATREARWTLLRRAGVRYCITREPLPDGAVVLARVPNLPGIALFECDPHAARAVVVGEARIVASSEAQAHDLLRPEGGDNLLMLKAPPPPPAGTSGAPVPASAVFVRDAAQDVELRVGVGEAGGYLLLRDSYSPSWQAEVDGRPATMLRANLLFRAVRLTPGTHTVRFTYAPSPLYYGAAVSGVAALGLVAVCCWPAHRRRLPAQANVSTPGVARDRPVLPA